MSTNDITTDISAYTDKGIPTDTDKMPILSDGNDAKILGTLERFRKWTVRTGRFGPFFWPLWASFLIRLENLSSLSSRFLGGADRFLQNIVRMSYGPSTLGAD